MGAGQVRVVEIARQLDSVFRKTLDNGQRQMIERTAAEFGECPLGERLHVRWRTECRLDLLPLGQDVLRLQCPLGELRAVRLFLFGGILPVSLQRG